MCDMLDYERDFLGKLPEVKDIWISDEPTDFIMVLPGSNMRFIFDNRDDVRRFASGEAVTVNQELFQEDNLWYCVGRVRIRQNADL